MKKLFNAVLVAATILFFGFIVAAAFSPPAKADELFVPCYDGQSAVVYGTPTSCAFAHNVHEAWYGQLGNPVVAYSPTTNAYYSMYCVPYTARLTGVTYYNARRCTGGNSAAVIVW